MPTTVYVIAHLLPASHAWWLASLRARGKLACSWQVCVLVGEFACTWASLRARGRVCVLVGKFACPGQVCVHMGQQLGWVEAFVI